MDRFVLQIEVAIAEDIATDPAASAAQRARARRDIRNLRTKLARLRQNPQNRIGSHQIVIPAPLPRSHS